MHCRMFSSIPLPNTLEASSTLWSLIETTKNISGHCQISSGGGGLPRNPYRNTGLTNDWAHKALPSLKKKSILIILNVTQVSSALQSMVLMSSRSEDWSLQGLMHSFSNHLLSGLQLHCTVRVAERKARKTRKATNALQELLVPHSEWKKAKWMVDTVR